MRNVIRALDIIDVLVRAFYIVIIMFGFLYVLYFFGEKLF